MLMAYQSQYVFGQNILVPTVGQVKLLLYQKYKEKTPTRLKDDQEGRIEYSNS